MSAGTDPFTRNNEVINNIATLLIILLISQENIP